MAKGLFQGVKLTDRIADGVVTEVNYADERDEEIDNVEIFLELRRDGYIPDDPRLGIAHLSLCEMRKLHSEMGTLIAEVEASTKAYNQTSILSLMCGLEQAVPPPDARLQEEDAG